MHITGMVHININCTDFQRSKAFYEMLGFQVYWPVPETNTEEVAGAVGMPKYQVEGALMALAKRRATDGHRPLGVEVSTG